MSTPAAQPGDPLLTIERLREVAEQKLPEVTALMERGELVRDWLECAARCERPDLGACPLFDDPPLLPRAAGDREQHRRPPRRGQGKSAG